MKKKVTVVIAIIVLIILVTIGVHINSNSHTDNQLKSALSDKYGWEEKDIKIEIHEKANTVRNFDLEGSTVNHYNEKWVCEYNERKFNVEYTDRHFADDYQLEDIFNWCTEYLKNNVDKEIIGVEISSDIIYHSSEKSFVYSLPWENNKVFTKEDASEILRVQKENINKNGLGIFYLVNNVNEYGKHDYEHSQWIRGKEKYNKFCEQKRSILNDYLTDKPKIYLISKPSFNRTITALSGSGVQICYSVDLTKVQYVYSYDWRW